MGTISTSASDLGPAISVGGGPRITVPTQPNLVDYAPILAQKPNAIVWTDANRPVPEHGLAGQALDLVVTEALQSLLRAEPTGLAVEGLRRALIEGFNDAPKPVQFAILGSVGVVALQQVISNIDEILAQLGNSTFTIDVPVEWIGLEGVKLSLQVSLDNFNPRLSMVVLQLSGVFNGRLRVSADLDQHQLGIGWTLADNVVPGLNVSVNINGIGGPNPSGSINVRYRF